MGGGNDPPDEHESHSYGLRTPVSAPFTQSSESRPAVSSIPPASTFTPVALRLITHNIRYAATDLFLHERPWPERLPNLLRQFHHYAAGPFNPPSTIICLQEVLNSQLSDLSNAFGDAWTYVGVGRDDGKEAGEFNPIFYRPECWEKVHFKTIWLNETPERPGLGWDAGSNRICTCLVLRCKLEERCLATVMILCTHLDNVGPIARREGAKLIVKYSRRWWKQFTVDHILLAGDLNSTSDERDGAWKVLNDAGGAFIDVGRLLRSNDVRHFGDEITFTGFDGNGDDDPPGTLDFVHYGSLEDKPGAEASRKLQSYSVVPNVFDDGVRCSDHRAVVVDLLL